MSGVALSFKYGAVLLSSAAIVVAVQAVAADPQSLPHRLLRSYIAYLDRGLRDLFITTRASRIVAGQCVAMCLVSAAGVSFRIPAWWTGLVLVALVPAGYVRMLHAERVKAIEARLDGFVLALANALRSTPSIGNALGYTQPLLMPPMNQEVALALKEMRVGNTVDQALLNMSARIRSAQLDAALSGLLIGRQVGGDLPKILETTANTLREMARLQGALRAKTAEGKLQVVVLAVAPIFVFIGFDFVQPGYFQPIAGSVVGWALVVLAAILWLAAVVVAQRVLKVEI